MTRLLFLRSRTTRKQDTQTGFFSSCDLDLDPLTLIHNTKLNVLKTYLHTEKMKFLGHGFQKLEHYRQTGRQTDTQTDANETITTPHSWVVIIASSQDVLSSYANVYIIQ